MRETRVALLVTIVGSAMGKAVKSKLKKQVLKPYTKRSNKVKAQSAPRKSAKAVKQAPKAAPTIPFHPTDRILLIGEGDFSFSRSLLVDHHCTSLIATSYDTESAAISKYPQGKGNTRTLATEEGCRVIYGVDATKLGRSDLATSGGKEVKKGGFDKVVFNFPHVGGLTKDVNRQVRHNQELLVGFFKAAISLLVPGGSIIVTIFEGEPYDLWNIKDLARHIGLKAERSFKFQASAYPGYKHARTLGNIEGGGGWKGEDRQARTYIFQSNEGKIALEPKRKRSKSDESSEDE